MYPNQESRKTVALRGAREEALHSESKEVAMKFVERHLFWLPRENESDESALLQRRWAENPPLNRTLHSWGVGNTARPSTGAILLWASCVGSLELVQEVLKRDGGNQTVTVYGGGPLMWASLFGHADIVATLLGTYIPVKGPGPPLLRP